MPSSCRLFNIIIYRIEWLIIYYKTNFKVIRNQLGVNLHHVTGLNYIFIKAQQMINYPPATDTLHLQRKMTLAFFLIFVKI
jgi:hypothetical protein